MGQSAGRDRRRRRARRHRRAHRAAAAGPEQVRRRARHSLSDNIAFGTAPALILFLWSLQTAPRFGWIAALALAVCCALRLARFNARIDAAAQPHKSAGFNTGVPAPVGAGLAFVPIYLWLITGNELFRSWHAGDAVDAVHRRADDLQRSDLQLVEPADPPRLAAVRAGGRRVARRRAGRRAVEDAAGALRCSTWRCCRSALAELCAGQAAARSRGRARDRPLQPRCARDANGTGRRSAADARERP